ncbi:hypothetical protein V474_01900 [Novosphingobium barchaimii LL02]|uniref:Lipoprotein n=1 Tax=Novosphingobium barchaimii LL02 TaxID=1114963 RepID=A0A0J8A920_9SPHN|nr:hypothetical protein [Novosphingobium barchaimii]KMS51815.1 hypothetical protein V474_01900 [Novosphingobium barchaimii LL02]
MNHQRPAWPVLILVLAACACSSDKRDVSADHSDAPAAEVANADAMPQPKGEESLPTSDPAPDPASAPDEVSPAPDLARYVGKNPFDKVDGVAFLDHPTVQSTVKAAVNDAAIRKWVLAAGANPWQPIWRHGDDLVTAGCQQHGCEQRSWTIVITPATKSAKVCFEKDGVSRWYSAGRIEPYDNSCPFDEADLGD